MTRSQQMRQPPQQQDQRPGIESAMSPRPQSDDAEDNAHALRQMAEVLKPEIVPSAETDLARLNRKMVG